MYHECLSTSLLSLQIAARIMQEKCRMQILYSCLWTFFVERLWYTCPHPPLGADEIGAESWQLVTIIHSEGDSLMLCE